MSSFQDYISLDLETTGLDPNLCDVIEIAMIKVRSGEIVDRFESFVYTPLELSQHISYLTGITTQDIENAPDFIDLRSQIQEFIGDEPLMGHNIWFDWNFLVQKGIKLDNNELWDTYLMSNILYPELPSHSLETNTKYFGIPHEDSHRAMADVMACYELWQIFIDSFPEVSPDQREQIKKLSELSTWPLMEYFLEEKQAVKHQLAVPDSQYYHPQSISLPDDTNIEGHTYIHCRGFDPVDIAHSLETDKKTLFIAGYHHTIQKIKHAYPKAYTLQPPHSYLSEKKIDKLWQKEQLETGESLLLLKHILYPDAVSQDQLVLSHPERSHWPDVQHNAHDGQGSDSYYQKAYQESLNSQQVIVNHLQVFKDLEYLKNFEQVVVLEPQLLEQNATRSFGKNLTNEDWLRQSSDLEWQNHGKSFFEDLERIGNSIVPSSQYTEHLILTDRVTSSNEFIRLRSSIKDLISEIKDQTLSSYLKYFQAFFNYQDPTWIRWITVDPRRGVSLNLAPLSIKSLLDKHLFQKCKVIVISETTADYGFLPTMEKVTLPVQQNIKIVLPEIEKVTGSKRDGDHQALISYLADELPQLKGKTAVVFSAKTQLKRYFFDLVKVMPEEMLLLGEDLSGGTSKLLDIYLSSDHSQKVMFLSYRNLRSFPIDVLDFDQIIIQNLPFDPPGYPIHQARSAQYNNPFYEYSLPNTQQYLLEILTNFTKRDVEKTLYLLDRRLQEKEYGEDLLSGLNN